MATFKFFEITHYNNSDFNKYKSREVSDYSSSTASGSVSQSTILLAYPIERCLATCSDILLVETSCQCRVADKETRKRYSLVTFRRAISEYIVFNSVHISGS